LWTDKANVWRFGAECRAKWFRNIVSKDIDVIHWSDRWGGGYPVSCVALQPAEEVLMENIRFENIRIHSAKEPCFGRPVGAGDGRKVLFDVRPQVTQWSRIPKAGRLKDVYFKDITVYGEDDCRWGVINIGAPDEEHSAENITFENVVRWGELVREDSPEVQISGAVHNVRFIGPANTVAMPRITPTRAYLFGEPVEVRIVCATPGADIRYTTDGKTPTADSSRYTAPFRLSRPCVITAKAFRSGLAPSYAATATLIAALKSTAGLGDVTNGVEYRYYERPGGGDRMPAYDSLAPTRQGTAPNFDITVEPFQDASGFVFAAYVEVPADGIYTFIAVSDGGTSEMNPVSIARVYLDSTAVSVDDPRYVQYNVDSGRNLRSLRVPLRAGKHLIRLDYFNYSGGKKVEVFWKGPGIAEQPIPQAALFRKEG